MCLCIVYTIANLGNGWFVMVETRLRDLREDRDIKQKEIGAYLNCSQACYARYESGSREIPLEALIALAKYYRTSVDYILRLTDEIRPYPVARKNMI